MSYGNLLNDTSQRRALEALLAGENELPAGSLGPGSVPRSVAAELSDRLSVKSLGALGDGATDDLASFTTGLARNARLHVPQGVYRWFALPDLSSLSVLDLEGDGENDTIIELDSGAATKSIATGDLDLLRVKGIQFKGFDTVFQITGDIGRVELDAVKLRDSKCLMADDITDYNGSGTPENFRIDHFRMVGCDIDGAESGVSAVVEIRSAYVAGNLITNLSHDADFFAIRLGNDSEVEQEIWSTQGKIVVTGNIISSLTNTKGSDVIMNGIIVMGRDTIISNNIVAGLYGSSTNCEAIYTKAHRNIVHDNICYNAGTYQAAINIKGRSYIETAIVPIGSYSKCHDNLIWFDDDYETSRLKTGIHVETDRTEVYRNRIRGSTQSGVDWNAQVTSQPAGIYIEDNVIEHWSRLGISCSGMSDTLHVKRNKLRDCIGVSATAVVGIRFSGGGTTSDAPNKRNFQCVNNDIEMILGSASTGQMTAISCQWEAGTFDDLTFGGDRIVCTHATDSTRGYDVNGSGTSGWGKTIFNPSDIVATVPYMNFNDANFRPTELQFRARVRVQTTDNTTAYPVRITLADGKSVAGSVKARALQTSGTPSASTVLEHELRNVGAAAAGAATLGTAVAVSVPAAGVSGWAAVWNATGADIRAGVDGAASTTIEWLLDVDWFIR